MNPLRAHSAQWFEVLVAREWVGQLVQDLAATGVVELDCCETTSAPLDMSALHARLQDHRELIRRYADYHPAARFEPLQPGTDLERTLDAGLARLERWGEAVAPHVARLEAIRHEQEEAALLREFLLAVQPETGLDFDRLREPGSWTHSTLYILDRGTQIPVLDRAAVLWVEGESHAYVLALTANGEAEPIARAMAAAHARAVRVPQWASGSPPQALAGCDVWLAELQQTADAELAAIARLTSDQRVAEAIGDVRRLQWLCDHLGGIPVSNHLAYVTGWTSDPDGTVLKGLLAQLPVPAMVHFPPPPADKVPPTLIVNPRWARPFEIFGRLVGTPSTCDPEPSRILAVVVPLLFGYMFADIGQGLVLLVAGLWLRRRWPDLGLLVPGGVMAMLFGWMFGSVFALESVIPPLWLHPLESPLTVLGAPLVFGGLLILFGLLLGALAALWSGHGVAWLTRDCGVVLAFLGAASLLVSPYGGLALAAGILWFTGGHAFLERSARPQVLGAGLGEFAERALQLAVNTISFVRVGAFALAHAGLGVALESLASATDSMAIAFLILLLGNALIILIEGLVVSIQTARLILFEFFVRFYTAQGRPFRPTALPPLQ